MLVKVSQNRKRNSFTPQTTSYSLSDQNQRLFDRQQLRIDMIRTSMSRYRHQLDLKREENQQVVSIKPTLFIKKTKDKKDQNDLKLLLQTRRQLFEKLCKNREFIKKKSRERLLKSAHQTPVEQNWFSQDVVGEDKYLSFLNTSKPRRSSIKQTPLSKKYKEAFQTPLNNDSLFPTALQGGNIFNNHSQEKDEDDQSINEIIRERNKSLSFKIYFTQKKANYRLNQNTDQLILKFQDKKSSFQTPIKSNTNSRTTKSTPSSDNFYSRQLFTYDDACYLFNKMKKQKKNQLQ